jgi:hypothetical protein
MTDLNLTDIVSTNDDPEQIFELLDLLGTIIQISLNS